MTATRTNAAPPPLVGLSCCLRKGEGMNDHRVGDKYVTAVSEIVGACPVLIPALEEGMAPALLVERLDGLVLTGSPSNVDPVHYGGAPQEPTEEGYGHHDLGRDAVTLPLIRAAVAAGLPLFGICRGIQEINVAFGGTLMDKVQEDEARLDHRMRRDVPYDWKYRPAHPINLTDGGVLHRLAGPGPHLVNSLHGQAVDRPGERIVVEAVAPDGVIEAIRVEGASDFAIGVQWHAEWPRPVGPLNAALFEAFGKSVRTRAARRSGRVAGLETAAE